MTEQEFYNLCQEYRHAPISDQKAVTKAFNRLSELFTKLQSQNAELSEKLRRTIEDKANSNISTINELEAKAIQEAVTASNGDLTKAATGLGIGRATLYRKVKQYNIDPSLARREKKVT